MKVKVEITLDDGDVYTSHGTTVRMLDIWSLHAVSPNDISIAIDSECTSAATRIKRRLQILHKEARNG